MLLQETLRFWASRLDENESRFVNLFFLNGPCASKYHKLTTVCLKCHSIVRTTRGRGEG